MNKKKLIPIIAISLVALLSATFVLLYFVFDIFNKDKGGSSGAPIISEIPEVEATIELNSQVLPLVIGDYAQIKATTNNLKGWSVHYNIEDTNIATIDSAGNIEALNEGKTKITATYTNGKKSKKAECEVNVGYGGMVPEFDFVQNIDLNKKLNLATNSEFIITPVVKFNGRTYYDAKFQFDVLSANAGVLTYDANSGMLKSGSTPGEVKVDIKTVSWKGKDYSASINMKKTIVVNVIDTSYMMLNGDTVSNVQLYTVDNFDGVNYLTEMPFSVQVNTNGSLVPSEEIDISIVDESVVKYNPNSKSLRTVGYGETIITLSYVNDSGFEIVQSLVATVTRPRKVIETVVDNFVVTKGQYRKEDGTYSSIADFIGESVTFTNGTENGKALTIGEGNRVLGVYPTSEGNHTTNVVLGTDKVVYEFTLVVYKHILEDADDLYLLQMDEDYEGDGYWLLVNDIDAEGIYLNHSKYSTATGFTGVLDGDGHSIFNLDVSKVQRTNGTKNETGMGLFGYIGIGGSIKNIGFVDMNSTKAFFLTRGTGGDCMGANASMKDCYIKLSSDTKYPRGICYKFNDSFVMENVIIEYDGKFEDPNYEGKYLNFNAQEAGSYVGLICSDLKAPSAKSSNVYVLSEYPICWNTVSGMVPSNKNNNTEISYVRAWRFAENDTVVPGRLFYDSGKGVPAPIPKGKISKLWNAHDAGAYKKPVAEADLNKDYNGKFYAYSTEDIDPETGLLLPKVFPGDKDEQGNEYFDENGKLKEAYRGLVADPEPVVVSYSNDLKTIDVSSINVATFGTVRRYDSSEILSENKNVNIAGKFNVNKFTTDFWQIVDGVPKFKTADTAVSPIINGVKVSTNKYNVATVDKVHTIEIETTIGVSLKVLDIQSSDVNYIEPIAGSNRVKVIKGAENNEDKPVELTIKYDRNGVIAYMTITFIVTSESKQIDTELEWSALDGKFTYSELGLASENDLQTITAAEQIVPNSKDPTKEDVIKLKVKDGLITNASLAVKEDKSDVNPIKLKVYYGDKSYYFTNLKAYSKVIKSGADMKVLALSKDLLLEGYYVLASNIDMTGVSVQHNDVYDKDATEGFAGVFNGRGYVISNFDATVVNNVNNNNGSKAKVGLFGKINGGTIMNVAFKDLKATKANYFADYSFNNLVINNVYINLSADTELPKGLWGQLLKDGSKQAKGNNVVVEYTTSTELERYKGLVMDGFTNESVGVFCSSPAGVIGGGNIFLITPYYLYSGGNANSIEAIQMDRYAENEVYLRAKITKQDGSQITVKEANNIYNTLNKDNTTGVIFAYLNGEEQRMLEPSVNISIMYSARRYDSREAMKADAGNNAGLTSDGKPSSFNLAKFDAKYWTVLDGVPTWNNL